MSWDGTGYSFPLFTPNLKFILQMNTSLPSGSLPARYSAARISSFGWLSANQSLALLCFPLLIQCWDIPRKSATSSTHSLFQEVAEWGGYLALPLSRRPTGHHIFVIVTRYTHAYLESEFRQCWTLLIVLMASFFVLLGSNKYTFVPFSCFSWLSVTSSTILNGGIHAYSWF